MTTVLYYDTETTGLVRYELPFTDEAQPYVLQFAYMVIEYDGSPTPTVRDRGSLYVRWPNGAEIPAAATRVHGITQATVSDLGVSPELLLDLLDTLGQQVDATSGHNVAFDRVVLDIAAMRCGRECARWMDSRSVLDTQFLTKNILKLPSKYPRSKDYAYPKLAEAHTRLCGFDPPNAHDAMGDVIAVVNVVHAVLTRGGTSASSVLHAPAGLPYPFYRS